MKFNINWLKQYIELDLSADEIAVKLTSLGLEVEAVAGDVIEIAITPDRGDCFSITGIARDLAALCDAKFNNPLATMDKINCDLDDVLAIKISAEQKCPKYCGRIIKGIDNTKPAPHDIKQVLTDAGVNLVNPVVDIVNYAMLETGQPMHAFDLSKIQGSIDVRCAKTEEKLELLDKTEYEFNDEDLLIADEKGPLALAGIMGGIESSVLEDTQDLFIESAFFDAVTVRLSARGHKIITDASTRYERVIDYAITEQALDRVSNLIIKHLGGKAAPIISKVIENKLPSYSDIKLNTDKVNEFLGSNISQEFMLTALTKLGFEYTEQDKNNFIVKVPSWRSDCERDVDLIEEIARVYGFDNIANTLPLTPVKFDSIAFNKNMPYSIKEQCVALGYSEAMVYSFIDKEFYQYFADSDKAYTLLNPISEDMSQMRSSLLPGLLKTAIYNINRKQNPVKLFETGLTFQKTAIEIQQQPMLAGIWAGKQSQANWASEVNDIDFYDIKQDVESLLEFTKLDAIEFKPATCKGLHSGQCAKIYSGANEIGVIGKLAPDVAQKLKLKLPVFMFELSMTKLGFGKKIEFANISKFPSIKRDMAVVIDDKVIATDIIEVIKQNSKDLLHSVNVFDVFQGASIGDNKKSVAFGMVLQHKDRTLEAGEADIIFENIVNDLKTKFGAVLRD